jgi:hypothetical protein
MFLKSGVRRHEPPGSGTRSDVAVEMIDLRQVWPIGNTKSRFLDLVLRAEG